MSKGLDGGTQIDLLVTADMLNHLFKHFATVHSYHCDRCTSAPESHPMQDEHLWASDSRTHPKCYYCCVGFKDLCALSRVRARDLNDFIHSPEIQHFKDVHFQNTTKSSSQPGESFASCHSCHITFGCQISVALVSRIISELSTFLEPLYQHFSCVHLSTSSPRAGDKIPSPCNSIGTPLPVSSLTSGVNDSLSHQVGTTRPESCLSVSTVLSDGDDLCPATIRGEVNSEDSEADLPTLPVLNHDTLRIIDTPTDFNPGR